MITSKSIRSGKLKEKVMSNTIEYYEKIANGSTSRFPESWIDKDFIIWGITHYAHFAREVLERFEKTPLRYWDKKPHDAIEGVEVVYPELETAGKELKENTVILTAFTLDKNTEEVSQVLEKSGFKYFLTVKEFVIAVNARKTVDAYNALALVEGRDVNHIIAINYSNEYLTEAQKINSLTAYYQGKADLVLEYSPIDIDKEFIEKNIHILKHHRGGGYWLWKPYIILKTLNSFKEGDYIFYADSGSYYVNKIQHLIEELEKYTQDIMPFQIPFLEKAYTKRDAFILMDCDEDKYAHSLQFQATFILIKNTAFSRAFFEEFLFYAQDERIITDIPNTLGKENHPEFIENRHDQTIFSLLCKKRNLKFFRSPDHNMIDGFSYPKIVVSTRRRNNKLEKMPGFTSMIKKTYYETSQAAEQAIFSTLALFTPDSANADKHPELSLSGAADFPIQIRELMNLNTNHTPVKCPIISEEEFAGTCNSDLLMGLFRKYGSDKSSIHNYHKIYAPIIEAVSSSGEDISLLEIGIGSNKPEIVSTMGRSGDSGVGGSLKAFHEYMPNARIFGADIDRDVIFEWERIKTTYVNQTDYNSFIEMTASLGNDKFNIIIDDGLHAPEANLNTLLFGIKAIKDNGWIIIEDIQKEKLVIWDIVAGLMDSKTFNVFLVKTKAAFVFIVHKKS